MVSKGNHPQMALFQVSELLQFAQIYLGYYKWGYMMIIANDIDICINHSNHSMGILCI